MKIVAGIICVALASVWAVNAADAAKKPKKEKVEYLRAAGSEPPPKPAKKK